LDQNLAQRIVQFKKSQPQGVFSSLQPVQRALPDTDFKKLLKGLESLSPFEAGYLAQTPEAKKNFVEMVMRATPPSPKGES
jgi:hypothetical protein